MKSWLEKNDIEMYSMHNEETSAVAERFIKTLKNTIYKHMSVISKNVYIDKLDAKVNKYNNRYHSTIKMKLVDVKLSTYIDSNKEINNKDPKFNTGDIEYQSIKTFFQKAMFQIGLKKFLWLKKLKTLFRGYMLLVILREKKLLDILTKKICIKQIKKSLELKK